jgi:hypothetical protein
VILYQGNEALLNPDNSMLLHSTVRFFFSLPLQTKFIQNRVQISTEWLKTMSHYFGLVTVYLKKCNFWLRNIVHESKKKKNQDLPPKKIDIVYWISIYKISADLSQMSHLISRSYLEQVVIANRELLISST